MEREQGTGTYCAIISSHQLISAGLNHLLSGLIPTGNINIFATVTELKQEVVRKNRFPDLVIVPFYTPGFVPVDTIRTLKFYRLSETVAILASINSRSDRQTALRAGADLYWDQYTTPETIRQIVGPECRQNSISDRSSASLTERQRQVLDLAAKGFSNKEIARSLTISPETVKSHLKQVYSRFSVTNRIEAAHFVRKLNLT